MEKCVNFNIILFFWFEKSLDLDNKNGLWVSIVCIYPHVGIEVTQSLNAVTTTIGVEMNVVPNTNVVRKGVIIGSIINLGRGLGGLSMKRNLSRSLKLLATNTKFVGTPHIMFFKSNNDYSCTYNYKLTTDEFNNY
jgi:hypothetical protein